MVASRSPPSRSTSLMTRAVCSSRLSRGWYRHARPTFSRCSTPLLNRMLATVMTVV